MADQRAFSRAEVVDAFKRYFMTGPVFEDWIAWSHLFTDDAVYFDHHYGRFRGPQEIQLFIESTMMAGRHCYTVLEWYNVDGNRIVWKGINRADHPDSSQKPFDFPSLQVIEYAGDGRWRSEEDWWLPSELARFARGYAEACRTIDPGFAEELSRRDWGEVDWARPPEGHRSSPSWLGREHEIPTVRRREDMKFGERV